MRLALENYLGVPVAINNNQSTISSNSVQLICGLYTSKRFLINTRGSHWILKTNKQRLHSPSHYSEIPSCYAALRYLPRITKTWQPMLNYPSSSRSRSSSSASDEFYRILANLLCASPFVFADPRLPLYNNLF